MTGSVLPLGNSTFVKELCFGIQLDTYSNLDPDSENFVWRMARNLAH